MSVEIAQELVKLLQEKVDGHAEAARSLQETRERSDRLQAQFLERMMGKQASEGPSDLSWRQDDLPLDPYAGVRWGIAIGRALMHLYAQEEVRAELVEIYDLLHPDPAPFESPSAPILPETYTKEAIAEFWAKEHERFKGRESIVDEQIRQENEREERALALAREVLARLSE